jgi:hypothetical protein
MHDACGIKLLLKLWQNGGQLLNGCLPTRKSPAARLCRCVSYTLAIAPDWVFDSSKLSFGNMAVSFLTVAYRHEKARLLASVDA